MDFSAHSIIWTILVGLVIGAIAKLLMPGKDPGGCIITILLGIAGALVGTWIGRIFAGGNYVAGWIMSIVGAMILRLVLQELESPGKLVRGRLASQGDCENRLDAGCLVRGKIPRDAIGKTG